MFLDGEELAWSGRPTTLGLVLRKGEVNFLEERAIQHQPVLMSILSLRKCSFEEYGGLYEDEKGIP